MKGQGSLLSDLDHPVGGLPNISEPIGSRAQPNTLRHYAAVLRRRWVWIVLGVAVGLLAGAASTLLIKEERDPNHYYKATNTLIANGAANGSQSGGYVPNLQQAAYLVHSADVVSGVATELNLDPQKVNDQVSARLELPSPPNMSTSWSSGSHAEQTAPRAAESS